MREYLLLILSMVGIIIGIILGILVIIKATPEQRKKLAYNFIYTLAVEAERLYGSKTGQIKKKQVIAWFYERYKKFSWLITQETLEQWIDEAASNLTDWIKNNPLGAQNLLGVSPTILLEANNEQTRTPQ